MKNSNQMIENRLKRAVEASVPNSLPKLLKQIEEKEAQKMTNTNYIEEKVTQMPEKRSRSRNRWIKTLVPVAAALAIVIGGLFGFLNYSTQSVIAFEVNPSIEVAVNRSEKVLKLETRNVEAEQVVGDMDLKGVDLDIAVNALIGSMVRNGYIDEINNSILITVDSKNAEKGIELQERLSDDVQRLLSGFSVDGAVLSQTSDKDAHIQELAEQYGISPGKAALIDELVTQDPTIDYATVAALSINDINLLIDARKPELDRVKTDGTASSKAYIGVERAKEIAFRHAGVNADDIREMEVELDFDDGKMLYELEFKVQNREFEYDIDAKSGEILKYEVDGRAEQGGQRPSTEYIGLSNAEDIAFKHAGVSRNQVRDLDSELERDDGKVYYEVDFEVGNTEYEYDIDAVTGRILDYEIDHDDDDDDDRDDSRNTTSTTRRAEQTSRTTMSRASAEDIAFKHAGVSRSQVRDLDTELERDDGKVYYEIDFEVGDTEYEYDIEAYTGRILDYDIDYDDDDDDDRPRTTTKAPTTTKAQTTTKAPATTKAPTTTKAPSAELIGRTRAENIAFQHAGVTRSQVRDLETDLDSDDGRRYYEVEFEVGDTEYEYDIEAYTGRILDYEIDYDD